MRQILNDIEAGKVTDELRRRGIPPGQRLRVVVESIEADEPSITAMNRGRRLRLAGRRARSL
jgi:hypothetical protein